MRAAVLILLASALPVAAAEPMPGNPAIYQMGFVASAPETGELGRVRFFNPLSPGGLYLLTIPTPAGDLVLSYESTPNIVSDVPDKVSVLAVPEGTIATPAEFEIGEEDRGEIVLRPFVGM